MGSVQGNEKYTLTKPPLNSVEFRQMKNQMAPDKVSGGFITILAKVILSDSLEGYCGFYQKFLPGGI
jgi:hypothetical protein